MSKSLLAISISHRRAPVEVREALQLSDSEARAFFLEFPQMETLVLSTCNRTEIYALPHPNASAATAEELLEQMFELKQLSTLERERHTSFFETLHGNEAIQHLFSVIAGIDSQVIGDQQIFAQVKEAFRLSEASSASGAFLNKLSQAAYRVAKRVISETTLNEGAATISYAAVEFARKIYDDLRARHILIVGAGESAELAAKHFIERNAGRIAIANRNIERAQAMAHRIQSDYPQAQFEILSLDAIASAPANTLAQADIILCATSAPEYVLTEAMMKTALEQRESSSPLAIIDIAVPRDVDPAIAHLPNVFLKDIDDLRAIVDRNADRRRNEIPKAETIIQEELTRFQDSLSRLEAGPTIKALRDKFESVRAEELERNRGKLDERSYALLDDMTRRMMNRLLHTPAISLKETNDESMDGLDRAELVRKLFGLDA